MLKFSSLGVASIFKAVAIALAMLSVMSSYGFAQTNPKSAELFGPKFNTLESLSVGEWWNTKAQKKQRMKLDVERDQVCAFAVYAPVSYTHLTLPTTPYV